MKVLLLVDEPSYAEAIAEFVVRHKWDADTQFKVMSVIEPLKVGSMMAVLPGPMLDEWVVKRHENAQVVVEDTIRTIDKKIPRDKIEKVIVEGLPTDEIMKEITLWQPEVLVVGSHGRQGLDRIILGSVSLFLVSRAPCSVIVIRPKEADGAVKKTA